MKLAARVDRLEAKHGASFQPFLVVLTAGRCDDEIIGLSGVPFERDEGETWPQYRDRAEQWAKGRCIVTIGRYRDDD